MNFNCEQIEARLSDYLEGALTEAEAAAYEAHAANCARCAELVASVRELVGSMRALEPEPAPPNLVTAILDGTLGPRKAPGGWKAWFGWTSIVWQPRFAYGALTVLVTMGVLSQALGIQWRAPTVADLNPVNLYRSVDWQVHRAYARGAKFFGDLRVVYEIQSRLQPATEQEALPPKSPETQPNAPGRTQGPSKGPLNLNQAEFISKLPTHVASALWVAPIRRLP